MTGPYEVLGPIRLPAETDYELEDPFLWKDGDEYHLMAKDMWGTLCGEPRAGVHAVSRDGVEWRWGDPVKAYSRTLVTAEGREVTFGSLERVGLVLRDGEATHLTAALSNGATGFADAAGTWNAVFPIAGRHPE